MSTRYTSKLVDSEFRRQSSIATAMESRFSEGIAIYGAGFLGTWAARHLKLLGVKISKFIDRDPRKIGGVIEGIRVIAPDALEIASMPAVFIASRHAIDEAERAIKSPGMTTMSFDGYFVVSRYQRLIAVRDGYLADERSVEVFNALLMAMLTGDVRHCISVTEKDMYFCLPEFHGNFDEIFVDAGAFVGDTVERFIWENLGTFRHLYAFEPGQAQFGALERRMRRLESEWAINSENVSLVRAGLAADAGRMSCTFLGDAPLRHGLSELDARSESQAEAINTVPVLALDAYLEGKPVTFIKADVEGMELELLRGAEQTIRTCRPKMALCVYHYPHHLYEVAEYVRSLVPEYKFSLRQHAPLFGDFVLYCYL